MTYVYIYQYINVDIVIITCKKQHTHTPRFLSVRPSQTPQKKKNNRPRYQNVAAAFRHWASQLYLEYRNEKNIQNQRLYWDVTIGVG